MKIKHIICYSLLTLSITILCVQYNIPQLLREFKKVGTFKPQAPHDFNEQRAWEIVRLMEIAAPTGAPRLELDLRRSLDLRSGIPAGSHADSARLRNENEQLRERIRILEAESQRRGARGPASTPTPDDCQAQLQACRERLDLYAQLTSRTITHLNDFERTIIAAAQGIELSTGWGLATAANRAQRLANAERFIEAARAQVQELGNLRNEIEQLFSAAS